MVRWHNIDSILYVLRVIYQAVRKDVIVHIRYPTNAVCLLVRPVLGFLPFFLLCKHLVAGSEDSFIIGSFLIWTLLVNVMIGASLFARTEATQGTLENLLVTRTNIILLFAGHVAGSMVRELINFALGVIIAISLFGLHLQINGLGVMTVLLSLAVAQGMGFVLGGMTLLTKRPRYSFMVLAIIGFLACPMYPVVVLPSVLQWFAYLNPLMYALDLCRGVLLESVMVMEQVVQLVVVGLFALAWPFAGYGVIAGAVRRMKVVGSTGRY